MSRLQRQGRGAVIAGLALVAMFQAVDPATAAQPKVFEARPPAPPAEVYRLPGGTPVERVVIKFHEGTGARLRDGVLQSVEFDVHEPSLALARGLDEAQVDRDAASVQHLLALEPLAGSLTRLFEADEQSLEDSKALGERKTGHQLADLNLYFEARLGAGSTFNQVAELVADLNRLASVEIAYAQPFPAPATTEGGEQAAPLAATPDLSSLQGYLDPAPSGIDARYAWTVPGGTGQGVRIVDVEFAWRTTHEDMPALFHAGGTQSTDVSNRNHGTAVLGEMVGRDNGIGVRGIAYGAQAGYESAVGRSTASAVQAAAAAAGSGNVVLIELHAPGPANGTDCTCNTAQCDYIPMEFWQAEFDAIANATANGVIVVEAGGNGSSSLDDPAYGGLFNRSIRDSRAVLVAASSSSSRSPTCWTNFGSRLDLHGWGENVVTMGYGDLQAGAEDQWYTASFSGTSSASPIVAGAVANVQGARRAIGLPALTPLAMRSLLVQTGTGLLLSTKKQIGPLPNLRKALVSLNAPPVPRFTYSCSGLSCNFDASTSTDDRGIASYSWTFGSLTATGITASPFLPRYGSHSVSLRATDTDGVSATKTQTITLTTPAVTPATGSWYNPSRSGNGISITRSGINDLTLYWFTYLADGTPIWYTTGTGPHANASWSQPLYKVTWNGSSPTLAQVGTASLVFSNASDAWFSWTLNGQPGGERFHQLFGGAGRTGAWFTPSESGWGEILDEQAGTLGAFVAIYDGSEPRWVLGYGSASGDVTIPLLWYTGPGLCPGCNPNPPRPTSRSAGTIRLQISSGTSTSGVVSTSIVMPSGNTWNRTNLPIARLTGP